MRPYAPTGAIRLDDEGAPCCDSDCLRRKLEKGEVFSESLVLFIIYTE